MTEPVQAILPALERALKDLRYGTVQLVVHDGRLIRLERIERLRLDAGSSETTPTGLPGGTSPNR